MDPTPPRRERHDAADGSPRRLRGDRSTLHGARGRRRAVRTGLRRSAGGNLRRPVRRCRMGAGARVRADRFTPDDTQLLSSVGRQIGVAIGNARLYATTREREREARILFETTGRFGELTDGDALLKAIVEGAVSLTRASYGGTGFPDGDEIVMRRLIDAPERGPAVLRLKIAGCLAGLTFVSGVPQVANDAARDPRVNRASARAVGVRNLACVPLQCRGRVIGVLFVGNKQAAPFNEQDVVRLRAFAHHAAVALENARLLHETKSTKEYLENLIASSVDAIVTLDPRGRVSFVSQGGRRMFGYSEGEVTGRPAH